MSIPVLTAPLLDPGAARERLELPEGLSLAEIVSQALPGLLAEDRAQLRVMLVSPTGAAVIEPRFWQVTRPKAGVQVVIRLVPGKGGARSILLAVVAVAALALAPSVAPLFGKAFGASKLGQALVGIGLNLLGAALVNAIVPPVVPDQDSRRNRYLVSGWANELRPGEALPLVLGRLRVAPVHLATPYMSIIGEDQYVTALLSWGYGPLKIEDIRIGDTPLSEFDEVETELREGWPGDAPVSLYPEQVVEDGDGVELVRPMPRDDAGEIIDGAEPIETPVVRVTASNAIRASVILHFPMGLYRLNREGEVRDYGIAIRIRQRQSSSDPWAEVTTLNIRARRDEAFQRQFTWDLPQRGRWQVEITRMTGESTKSDYINVSHLLALQSVRPEYPLNTGLPLALLAIRIRATHQLTGQLDQVNAVVQRYAPDWTGEAWETGLSRNPASAYVAALTGPGNPWPVAQGGLDWAALAEWHQFCAEKGLKYDRVHEGGESLGEALRAIAQAGRASPRHDGRRWSVVVDRPQTADRSQALVVDHLSPRNTRDFRWSRAYTDLPDALRVSFADESNGWDIGEMVIPRPGLVGAPQLTEELGLPGKTDPAEIWREGRRRFYEAMHRPDTFTCVMEGAARVATRGDLVMASWDVLARTQISARVRQALDRFLVIDEELPQEGIEEGGEGPADWGLRWRVYDGPDIHGQPDTVGRSVVAKITGQGRSLLVAGEEPLPEPGSLVHLGPLTQVSEPMVVVDVEPGEGFSARLTLVAEAAIIDALTEAEEVPAWDSIVGEVIPQLSAPPQMPVWRGLESGPDEESGEILLRVLLGASAGELRLLSGFVLEHRLTGAPSWTVLQIAAAEGGAEIADYTLGQEVQLRARALAFDGDQSPTNTTLTHVIGASAAPVPAALDPEGIVVSGGLGHATLALAVSDPATVTVQLYRTAAGAAFDPETDALGPPRAVTPGATVTLVDGDATRASLLADGGFDEVGVWTAGSGWTVGGGQASHTPGSAGVISQDVTLNPGSTYRVAFQIGAWVAGTLTPELAGGTLQQGAAVSGTGWHFAELVAASGNTHFRLAASEDFDGAVTAALLYIRTPACAPAGPVEYRLAPRNVDNVSGPTAGPFSTLIF